MLLLSRKTWTLTVVVLWTLVLISPMILIVPERASAVAYGFIGVDGTEFTIDGSPFPQGFQLVGVLVMAALFAQITKS